MHENCKSDSGCACSEQSDPWLYFLVGFLRGADLTHGIYRNALVRTRKGPWHRSQLRERVASEARAEAERVLSPLYLYMFARLVFAEGASAEDVKRYNEMAGRAWRDVRGLEDRSGVYQLLSTLARQYGKRVCQYCWKLLPANSPADQSVCSKKCAKGLLNRRRYLRYRER